MTIVGVNAILDANDREVTKWRSVRLMKRCKNSKRFRARLARLTRTHIGGRTRFYQNQWDPQKITSDSTTHVWECLHRWAAYWEIRAEMGGRADAATRTLGENRGLLVAPMRLTTYRSGLFLPVSKTNSSLRMGGLRGRARSSP